MVPYSFTTQELINLIQNARSGTKNLTPQQQKDAIMLYLLGYPIASIAAHMNVPKHHLYPFLKAYRVAEGTLMNDALNIIRTGGFYDSIEKVINITEVN